ncbi:MAG TPA: S-layer homology domain-containing protein, partial [Candidatus Gracilibacteria bacterium]|nr:S-layer homology domain-containing protein [Candidatus Gracilibacteria bacterium]
MNQKFMYWFSLGLLLVSFPVLAEAANFTDVTSGSIYAESIQFMKDQGVVGGYADGTFRPQNTINRAEFLKIVLKSQPDFFETKAKECVDKSKSESFFKDVDLKAWYAPYICYAKEQNIIQGYPDNTFRPEQKISFPEAAKIVSKTQNLPARKALTKEAWYIPYIEVLSAANAIPMTITSFSHQTTRGEMAEVLYRVINKKTDQESRTLTELRALTDGVVQNVKLGEVSSCDQLATIMKNSTDYAGKMYRNTGAVMEDAVMDTALAPTTAPESSKSESSSEDYSQTNVQVSGVDEADIVKNDGKYIYLIKGQTVRIVLAYPANE